MAWIGDYTRRPAQLYPAALERRRTGMRFVAFVESARRAFDWLPVKFLREVGVRRADFALPGLARLDGMRWFKLARRLGVAARRPQGLREAMALRRRLTWRVRRAARRRSIVGRGNARGRRRIRLRWHVLRRCRRVSRTRRGRRVGRGRCARRVG